MDKDFIKQLLEETDEQKLKAIIAGRVQELCMQYEQSHTITTNPRKLIDGKWKFDRTIKEKKVLSKNFKSTSTKGGSAYTDFFHPKYGNIFLSTGFIGDSCVTFDDVEGVYLILIKHLKQLAKDNKLSKEEILFRAVTQAVFEYVGGQDVEGDDKTRMSHLNTDEGDNRYGVISSFKGSKHAMCVERASIAHQLFKFLGVDSACCFSHIERFAGKEAHAFNLVKINGKTVLFDPTLIDRSQKVCANAVAIDNLDEEIFDSAVESLSGLSSIAFPSREITKKTGEKYMLYYSEEKTQVVNL